MLACILHVLSVRLTRVDSVNQYTLHVHISLQEQLKQLLRHWVFAQLESVTHSTCILPGAINLSILNQAVKS